MTFDRPAPGVVVAQPRRGFRYGSEPFWLVGFALEGGPARSAVDLGTGSGVAALLLARCGVATTGYDARPEWEACWAETLVRSTVRARLAVRDVADGIPDRVDLVVTNPPFFPAGSGPVAVDPWRAAARTESTATLGGFVEAGLAALVPGGRFCAVVPSDRAPEVERAGARAGAALRRLVTVGRRRALVELGEAVDPIERTAVSESDPRVRGWYARVAGGVGPA